MPSDLISFPQALPANSIAGLMLWALALYLAATPIVDGMTQQLEGWFDRAERILHQALHPDRQAFEKTKAVRESINSFYASLCSIVPFLMLGGICNYGVELGLGQNWSVSTGVLACICCGIYELGRRAGQASP